VADLDLTFSVDEDVMGKVVSHELFPGGRLTAVTNENRLNIFIDLKEKKN
jgi:ubiquitin-protein ligase E3 B